MIVICENWRHTSTKNHQNGIWFKHTETWTAINQSEVGGERRWCRRTLVWWMACRSVTQANRSFLRPLSFLEALLIYSRSRYSIHHVYVRFMIYDLWCMWTHSLGCLRTCDAININWCVLTCSFGNVCCLRTTSRAREFIINPFLNDLIHYIKSFELIAHKEKNIALGLSFRLSLI